jgi:hypothetical protein
MHIIKNLDYEDDLETAKTCFRIISTFMKVERPRQKISQISDEMMPYIVKTLESNMEVNHLGDCLKIMPILVKTKPLRKKMLMYKQDVLMAKLLKKIFDFSQLLSNEVTMDLIDFFSVIAEEEYQNLKTYDKIDILRDCLDYENLVITLMRLLEGYLEFKKSDWNVLKHILHCIEVLSFNEENVRDFLGASLMTNMIRLVNFAEEYG